jgi:hypothetical protein
MLLCRRMNRGEDRADGMRRIMAWSVQWTYGTGLYPYEKIHRENVMAEGDEAVVMLVDESESMNAIDCW